MDESKPSPRSRTRSSPAPSRAGKPAGRPAPARGGPPARAPYRGAPARASGGLTARVAAWESGAFPGSLYLEGPSEAVKVAVLAALKRAWHLHRDASPIRVLRAAEAGVDQILSAYHSTSLFAPGELVIVLDVEDLGRSDKKITALAAGIARGGGAQSSLVLVESAADSPRKSLDALRAACDERIVGSGMTRAELRGWGERAFARDQVEAAPGAIDALVDACEGDALAFFNELDKLSAWAGPGGKLTAAEVADLMRPVIGADLPEFLAAVALGNPMLATQRLGRLLAAGVGEGALMFALSNLVSGAMGGWARYREPSDALRRRLPPHALDRALDAVYRAEAAWKNGRGDVVALLEQTTRTLSGAA